MAEIASTWPKKLYALPDYFEKHRRMARFDAEVVVLVAALTSVESASAEELSTRVGFTVNDDHVRELREHRSSRPRDPSCSPASSPGCPGALLGR